MASTSVNLLASSATNAIDVAQVQAKTASTAIAKPFAQWLGDAQYHGNQNNRTEPSLPPDSSSYASAAPTAISALRDDPAQLNAKQQPRKRQRRNGS